MNRCTRCQGYIEPVKAVGDYPCDCQDETYSYRLKELETRLRNVEYAIRLLKRTTSVLEDHGDEE